MSRRSADRGDHPITEKSRQGKAAATPLRARLSADGHLKTTGKLVLWGAQQERAMMLAQQKNTYSYAQRRSVLAAARQFQQHSQGTVQNFFRLRRLSSSSLEDAARHDSYKFDGEESKVHFDRRFSLPPNHKRNVALVQGALVCFIAVSLAMIAAAMNMAVYYIHTGAMQLMQLTMWPNESETPHIGSAFLVYLSSHGFIVVIAACLTMWAPLAAMSGLPKLKSFLNGTYVKGGMLSPQTLVAKVLGITLVVASGLPLGKEGPMVHIGAMVAAIVTRRRWPGTSNMLELRLPQVCTVALKHILVTHCAPSPPSSLPARCPC